MKLVARQKRALFTIAIAAVAIALLLLAPAINRQLHSWKVLPEPERLTELYFTNSKTLPSTYAAGQTEVVTFTVHNVEYRTMPYTYTVEQISDTGSHKVQLAKGSFTLQQNQYANKKVSVTLSDLGRSKVSVSLEPVNETVDYWITRN